MDSGQQDLNQDSVNASEVMDSLGVDAGQSDSLDEAEKPAAMVKEDDPLAVKKRLGMMAKRHDREMRAVKEQLFQLQNQLQNNHQPDESSYDQSPQGMSIEEQIQRGVRYALQAQEEQKRKAQEAEKLSHVHRQYERLEHEFDKAADKYADFDEVVRGERVPFSPAIRDALLLVDNPADVAYKLGKNYDDLARISKLHPLEQAREVNKLSFALMGGNASSAPGINTGKTLSQIRANPVTSTSQAITDRTPPSVIRARMKAGTWK